MLSDPQYDKYLASSKADVGDVEVVPNDSHHQAAGSVRDAPNWQQLCAVQRR